MERNLLKQRPSLVRAAVLSTVISIVAAMPRTVHADEGGVSFWLPGIYGSLAAAPLQPG